jgi:Flavin containing amine oxidoreductase
MTSYVIAGGGASGLYTAYRLLSSGKLVRGEDTVELLEWSPTRVGGRINTYVFPDQSGQYVETGGMRFSKDVHFPTSIETGHVFVQNLIVKMGLQAKVVDFFMSNLGPGTGSGRLYYLRGQTFYEAHVTPGGVNLPYNFDSEFIANGYDSKVAEDVFGALANIFAPGSQTGWNRAQWCTYFARGVVPEGKGTRAFEAGTPIGDIGYWNLLYDQLGDEGFDYVTDANGFASNTINWHSADAMQSNTEFGDGSSYSRIQGGYSSLFEALRKSVAELGMTLQGRDPLALGTRLTGFSHDEGLGMFEATIVNAAGESATLNCSHLFLAMPRQSLELLAGGCGPDNPLNDPKVKLYIESAMNQPAYKVAMLFDEPWWLDESIVRFKPNLSPAGSGGPTMTDLPLRQIYYFGNDATPTPNGGPYVLLATYDDMQFVTFWQEMESAGDDTIAGSLDYQPLTGPTEVPGWGPMSQILLSQLASVHGADPDRIPQPSSVVFQDWGRNPFGAGYHGWAPHYDICTVMQDIRTPGTLAGKPMNLYIVGSCYSIDQAWVEGALCTAESVLNDFCGLEPFCALPDSYNLICTPADAKRPMPRAGSGDGKATPSGT